MEVYVTLYSCDSSSVLKKSYFSGRANLRHFNMSSITVSTMFFHDIFTM